MTALSNAPSFNCLLRNRVRHITSYSEPTSHSRIEVLSLIPWRKLVLTKDGMSLSRGFEGSVVHEDG